jgi:chaperonin GroEL (HSP60 family)
MSATTPPASALSTASSKRPASPDGDGIEDGVHVLKKARGDGDVVTGNGAAPAEAAPGVAGNGSEAKEEDVAMAGTAA